MNNIVAESIKPVLCVVTSHPIKGDTGVATGFWLSELTHPLAVLQDAGIPTELASARGGQPPVDGFNLSDKTLDLAAVNLAVVGLIVGLWWAYFLVPFAQVLHHRRGRGFLWGYGHAAAFAALAVLGGVLEIVADALKVSMAHAPLDDASHGAVTPLFAISVTAATVSVFLCALWWLGGQATRRKARSQVYILPVLLASGAAVVFVAFGLPLAWGLLLLAAGPALMVAWIVRHRHRHPEAFAVQ